MEFKRFKRKKKKKSLCSFLTILALLFASLSEAVVERRGRSSPCNGSIADCYVEAEFLMDSEIHRRFLQVESKYISYGTLEENKPAGGNPQPGMSYTRDCDKMHYCQRKPNSS